MTPHRTESDRDLILLGCGAYQTYLAIFDPTIFDLITGGELSSRLIVSIATVSAAGIPFFFGLGALKEAMVPSLETIFFFEKMLRGVGFWIASAVLTFSLIPMNYFNGTIYHTEGFLATVLAFFVGTYLLIIGRRRARGVR